MVICLERGADLHMAQLTPQPLTVSCFSKIQIGFTFLVPAHLGSPGKGPLNVCVCVCVDARQILSLACLAMPLAACIQRPPCCDKCLNSPKGEASVTYSSACASFSKLVLCRNTRQKEKLQPTAFFPCFAPVINTLFTASI